MITILLVEDEKIELDTLKNYVHWKDCGVDRVFTARGGRSALECVSAEDPDIIFTDIQMPGMTGMELAGILRAEGSHAKLVFLTGYDRFEYAREAIRLQASEFLLKPFRIDEVENLTRRLVEEIRKERSRKEISGLAVGKMIEQSCAGNTEEAELMAEACFGRQAGQVMLQVAAIRDKGLQGREKINELPELVHSFTGHGFLWLFLPATIHMEILTARIRRAFPGQPLQIVWYEKTCNLLHLEEACEKIRSCGDDLFYSPEEICLSTEEHCCWNTYQDRIGPMREKRQLLEKVQAGDADGAAECLQRCFALIKDLQQSAFCQNAFGLLIYIRRELQELDGGEQVPELPDILHADSFESACQMALLWLQSCCILRKQEEQRWSSYVRRFVSRHYMEDCTVEEMAEGIGVSPNYLRRKFKEETGITILEYLTNTRLLIAAELLENSDRKIKDVSLAVGYPNVSYFTQIFTRKFGVRPNEFKKSRKTNTEMV